MLATDMNNPAFSGAVSPDSALYVEFFWYEAVDAWASRIKSEEEQRNVKVTLPKAPFVRIMIPGDKTSETIQAVTEAHKRRFPQHWMAWQISEGLIGADNDIPGWKLAEWDEINADMLRELTYMRFSTVEQVAGASDKQIQGIGMGGLMLREKARVALRNRMGAETKAELDRRDAENADLKARLLALEERMAPAPDAARETLTVKKQEKAAA